jgi:hypothetical protein
MKRIQISCVVAVLLLTGIAPATLIVKEYIPGQKVTLDTNTGNHWIWDLSLFTNKTYGQQISDIAGLGTYGNIGGGWHMADLAEMGPLWSYSFTEISGAFNTSDVFVLDPGDWYHIYWSGRYDDPTPVGTAHYVGTLFEERIYSTSTFITIKSPLGVESYPDSTLLPQLGAWVTTDAPVVPAPGAIILGTLGLSLAGWKLRRGEEL